MGVQGLHALKLTANAPEFMDGWKMKPPFLLGRSFDLFSQGGGFVLFCSSLVFGVKTLRGEDVLLDVQWCHGEGTKTRRILTLLGPQPATVALVLYTPGAFSRFFFGGHTGSRNLVTSKS